jgi:TldD protein
MNIEPRYYDIRHVGGKATHIDIDNGIIESTGISYFDKAVLRVLGPRGWGLLTIDNYKNRSRSEIDAFIERAMRLSHATEEEVVLADAPTGIIPVPPLKQDPLDVSLEEKTELLKSIEGAAQIHEINNRRARYSEEMSTVSFTDSNGTEYTYEMARCGFSVIAVAQRNGLLQMARESEYTIAGLNLKNQEQKGRDAAERAVKLLDARPAKGGTMCAILDQELAGVFAHEAIGHASEGDLVKEGSSVIKGKIGEKIGNEILTIVDDPGIPEFGFEPVDAEGVAVQRTEIIRNGELRAYLHNRQTLAAVGDGLAGHARGVAGDPPIVRMSNTFIENGDTNMDELLEECNNGVLLKGSRGGQVDPGRGIFQFNAEYGYIIEGGEIREMIRDVSLSGEILQTLHAIILCGKDKKMSQGFCGKGGQSVPVSDGAPHILLDRAVVGGLGA